MKKKRQNTFARNMASFHWLVIALIVSLLDPLTASGRQHSSIKKGIEYEIKSSGYHLYDDSLQLNSPPNNEGYNYAAYLFNVHKYSAEFQVLIDYRTDDMPAFPPAQGGRVQMAAQTKGSYTTIGDLNRSPTPTTTSIQVNTYDNMADEDGWVRVLIRTRDDTYLIIRNVQLLWYAYAPPYAPLIVEASWNNPAGVRVNWSRVPAADTYTVYRTSTPTLGQIKPIIGTTSNLELLDTSLPYGCAAYYWVQADNTEGPGPVPDEYAYGFRPWPSMTVNATKGSHSDRVILSWNQVAANSYNLYRSTSSTYASASKIAPNISSTTYADTQIVVDQIYYYWLTMNGACGESDRSFDPDAYGYAELIHSVGTPNTPSGPNSGCITQNLSFSTGGSSCTLSHSVQYQFDWGDGTESTWGSSSRTKSYATTGTKFVRARARCATDNSIVSGWSSVKSVVINHTVSAPTVSGPGSGLPAANHSFTAGGSVCCGGHSVTEYQFRWGDGAEGPWGPGTQTRSYITEGTYQVQARARCSAGVVSDLSPPFIIVIEDHVVSEPNTPTGPSSGCINQSLSFSTGGSACNQSGHSVQYQFDWGDGTESAWGNATRTKSYTTVGTKSVRARARCTTDNSFVSGWSSVKSVVINHTVSTPNAPTGPSSGATGQSLSFSTGGSSCCASGHSVQYQFDWGDGTQSNWGSSSQSKTYGMADSYDIRARARCATDNSVVSGYSGVKSVTISDHAVGTPSVPTGPGTGCINQNLSFSTEGSSCNRGHSVQYQFDWGDGTQSAWGGSSQSKSFGTTGTRSVKARARCATDNSIVSGWSSVKSVVINHAVSTPNIPVGPSTGATGQSLGFIAGGSSCCASGHSVQYQFDWGDGTQSNWGNSSQSKTYGMEGSYQVRARARCAIDTSIVSNWSGNKQVSIVGVPPCNLGEALNAPDLTWPTGGHANWFCQEDVTRDGLAAQSGAITHNQQSWMQTTVTGPGMISFWWKVSSEANWDFLRFSIGATEQERISGNVDWQQRSFTVPAGTHTLKWQYDKDGSVSHGSDAGWVDQVSWHQPSPQIDFDGDGSSDVVVYHPARGDWYMRLSSTRQLRLWNWGWIEAMPVPGDYDGDGETDLAVYHWRTGDWYIRQSSTGQLRRQNWGWSEAIPVAGDYDGDGKTDLAVYHWRTGDWYIRMSSTGLLWRQNWGWSEAIPVPGDYDGDGATDIAVYHPQTGDWYIRMSSTGQLWRQNWGWSEANPVPGDYDGDGITDIAVNHPRTGDWYIRLSSTGKLRRIKLGWSETVPVPADYDGDGITDMAVYHPRTGDWHIIFSSTDQVIRWNWGWSEAIPTSRQYIINRWYRR